MSDDCSNVEALLDGYCDGDSDGLREALGRDYQVVWSTGYDDGYGHHGQNTLYRAGDGRLIHAECGGCSCKGYGSWSYVDSEEEAMRLVPESERDRIKLGAP